LTGDTLVEKKWLSLGGGVVNETTIDFLNTGPYQCIQTERNWFLPAGDHGGLFLCTNEVVILVRGVKRDGSFMAWTNVMETSKDTAFAWGKGVHTIKDGEMERTTTGSTLICEVNNEGDPDRRYKVEITCLTDGGQAEFKDMSVGAGQSFDFVPDTKAASKKLRKAVKWIVVGQYRFKEFLADLRNRKKLQTAGHISVARTRAGAR